MGCFGSSPEGCLLHSLRHFTFSLMATGPVSITLSITVRWALSIPLKEAIFLSETIKSTSVEIGKEQHPSITSMVHCSSVHNLL